MPRESIQDFLRFFIDLTNTTLIPLIFGIAIVFFIWNAARYFVFSGADEEGRSKAKILMIYGIAGMVFMLSLWGLVRMASDTFGLGRSNAPCPDFNPNCFSSGGGYGTGGFNADGTERYFDITNPGAGVQSRPASLY